MIGIADRTLQPAGDRLPLGIRLSAPSQAFPNTLGGLDQLGTPIPGRIPRAMARDDLTRIDTGPGELLGAVADRDFAARPNGSGRVVARLRVTG